MIAPWRDLLARLRRRRPTRAILVSDRGVRLVCGDRSSDPIGWAEVAEIVAFKRDRGIVDEIRLALRTADGWVEFSEEDEGWAGLIAALACRYPEVPPDWLPSVMFPPFARCERVLYDRDRPTIAPHREG